MDLQKVAMLAATAGLYEVPPDVEALVEDPQFWADLAETDEDKLTPEQQKVIAALGA